MRNLVALFLISACTQTPPPPPPKVDAVKTPAAPSAKVLTAQVPIGGNGDAQPTLSFKIDKVYTNEKPAAQAPWHAPGGEWTYFDARTDGGAAFTVGVKAKKPAGDMPFAFGDVTVVPASREAGGKLVEEFAKIFHAPAPAPGAQKPIQPAQLRVAVLGFDMACTPGGGCGGAGTWTATKWFLSGGDVEVFFNYDLTGKRGDFSEKDSDYRKGLVAAFAALRDGAPAK
jgi:hypothetical protein